MFCSFCNVVLSYTVLYGEMGSLLNVTCSCIVIHCTVW